MFERRPANGPLRASEKLPMLQRNSWSELIREPLPYSATLDGETSQERGMKPCVVVVSLNGVDNMGKD
ncbi:hypothetical protein SAMN05216215_1018103 [Saccharopolyspora shandongensis]|uniref:Uncharacterized protein n=1 Tax=Saccharopolyspora shandongensis TaxID=418495 RepID=A0A1H3GCZ2_9PSEU|nr:hypothetical protein SAMN05216215_1018103 [Saccharopolyspora shandongensis]